LDLMNLKDEDHLALIFEMNRLASIIKRIV
jgi:hypothetical protein